MSIQQNINQGLSIAGLLYQHSAIGEEQQEVARAKREAKRKTQAGRGRLYEGAATPTELRGAAESLPESSPRRELLERAAEATEVAEQSPSPRTRDVAEQRHREFYQSFFAGQEEEMAESWVNSNTPPSSGLSREYVKRFAKAHGYTYDAARKALSKAYIKKLTASARYKRAQQRVRERQQGGPK